METSAGGAPLMVIDHHVTDRQSLRPGEAAVFGVYDF